MEKETVQYKRTLRGSVGAGVSALFNGEGRRYYILEHKDASKYHKAGESQKIIIDQVELGRDANCQVRFDETFATVSRRHAAIIKDGDRWKLVQLSKKNSTFLNGRPVENEWYLENGDEIQLSVGGPRMGFIIPAGKQGLVSSIKMTQRLELFRKQALRPYKAAIACICAFVLVLSCFGGYTIFSQGEQIASQNDTINVLSGRLEQLSTDLTVSRKELESLKNQPKPKPIIIHPTPSADISKYEEDVYFIKTKQILILNNEGQSKVIDLLGWKGTGYLTNTGKFITAKHCVEGWKFKGSLEESIGSIMGELTIDEENDDEETKIKKSQLIKEVLYQVKLLSLGVRGVEGLKIKAYFTARSKNGNVIEFSSDDFKFNRTSERPSQFLDLPWIFEESFSSDWAYIENVGQKGKIEIDQSLSAKLPIGSELHILGFPLGMGADDTSNLHPLYGSSKTAQEGLDNGLIRISARNYESGNSGGPVFYMTSKGLKAIGIVSYSVGTTQGGIVPLYNIK